MPDTAQASPCSTLMTVLRGDGECWARREETAAEGTGRGGRPRVPGLCWWPLGGFPRRGRSQGCWRGLADDQEDKAGGGLHSTAG